MIPGANKLNLKDAKVDEKLLDRQKAIILSMTKEERLRPEIISGSRRKRIAAGSGNTVNDVNKLLKQYDQMKQMMKMFGGKGKKGRMPRLPF